MTFALSRCGALPLVVFRLDRALRVLAAALLVVLCSLPQAATAAALEQLREFVSSTRSARGEFTQQQVLGSGRSGQSSSGTFAFARPGKFRWEVSRPYEQLVVTDGERVHFFDKDLRQVTVRKVTEAISATPAAILFGSNDLEANFVVTDGGTVDGLEWLEAVPRNKESGFDRIRIGFKGGLPAAMDVRDAFGQGNRFTFKAIERNPTLDATQFRFTAPKGV
ncbi:MAG: outer membrane lipoprotein chaperone LolA, partial [Burkholderiales bacterium]|nr:outer membrane lipoprotein chaperone LolA [Burkholderiales bacterium]